MSDNGTESERQSVVCDAMLIWLYAQQKAGNRATIHNFESESSAFEDGPFTGWEIFEASQYLVEHGLADSPFWGEWIEGITPQGVKVAKKLGGS